MITADLAVDFLPGDLNIDGVVNVFDINLISANWGGIGPAGDANGDGTVNIFDINLVSVNWTVPGDVNGDMLVNIFDINLVSGNWGEPGPAGDANHDGVVNTFDINLISANWGAGASQAVPEPSSLALAVLAGIGLAVRGCRTRRSERKKRPHRWGRTCTVECHPVEGRQP